jgi:hypothetical protein
MNIRFAICIFATLALVGNSLSVGSDDASFLGESFDTQILEDLGSGSEIELHGGEPMPYADLQFVISAEAQQLMAVAMMSVPACQSLGLAGLAPLMTLLGQTQLPPLCGKYFGCVALTLLEKQKTMAAAFATPAGAAAVAGAVAGGCVQAFPKNCEVGADSKCPPPARTVSAEAGATTAATRDDYVDVYPGGDTICALGQKNYHFRVKHGDPKKVAVYFEGGGGCWSAATCKPNTEDITQSVYKYDLFMSHHVGPLPKMEGILSGADERNPIKGWTQVFVPYCTGDAHGGDKVTEYFPKGSDKVVIHHRGQKNVAAVMSWMEDNLPATSLTDLLVTGCSAGALGAQLHSNNILTKYQSVARATVLVDSYMGDAPAMWWNGAPEPFGGYSNWGADALFPNDALKESAKTSRNFRFSDMMTEVMALHPTRAFAFLQSEQDVTQRSFANLMSFAQYLPMSEDEYSGVVGAMLGRYNCGNPNFKSYVTAGSEHCWIHKKEFYDHKLNGKLMYKWVNDLINGNAPCSIASENTDKWSQNFAICANGKNEWTKQEGCFVVTSACANLQQTGPASRKETISSESACLERAVDVALECLNGPEDEVKAVWGPTGTFAIAKGESPTCAPPLEEGCWIERSGCARAGVSGAGDSTNVRPAADFEDDDVVDLEYNSWAQPQARQRADAPISVSAVTPLKKTLTQLHHAETAGFLLYKSENKDANTDASECHKQAKVVSDFCGNGEGSSVKSTFGKTRTSKLFKAAAHRPFPLTSASKVVVVGAGPAGVHMSSLLAKMGIKDVTILEKTERLGGKSYSKEHDGVIHEMGTCYLHNMYGTIRDLLQEYEIETTTEGFGLSPESAEIVPEGDRSVFSRRVFAAATGQPPAYGDIGGYNFGLQTWIGGFAVYDYAVKYGVKLPSSLATKVVGSAVLKYVKVHHQLVGDLKRGVMPEMPTSPAAKAAIEGKSMGEFLTDNGMSSLIGYLELAQSAQGYGLLFEVPALYGLWWIHPEILLNTITSKPKPSLTMLKKGYHQIWRAIAQKHSLNIVYKAHVTAITREAIAKGEKPVSVTYSVPDAAGKAVSTTAKFDFLVLAAPLRYAPTYVTDATADEKRIFDAIHAYTLTTTLYESQPVPNFTDEKTKATILYSDDNLQTGVEGHWYCDRYSKPCLEGIAAGTWNGTQARVSYQFNVKDLNEGADLRPPFTTNQALLTNLTGDIAKARVSDFKLIEQFPWSYFPHFGHEELKQGYPWELLSMQGTKNTWYIGSSACFESVHDVTTYNHIVLDRYSMEKK